MDTGIVHRPKRQRIRLAPEAYREPGSAWLVTIAAAGRWPLLVDAEAAAIVARLLDFRTPEMGLQIDAWCVMPDHVHMVAQVIDGDLISAVSDLKSRSTQGWWSLGNKGSIWQRSFHDHGLRKSRDWETAIRYVLTNPERSGLVDHWWDYPFLGGEVLGDP